ncbi:hypothetical protein [Massilia sp. BJB1822]|uniref:hypothetical protein n=1 Tax=Massilia sp. BJB1822 TaxID=2744470 RepID=UPI001C3D4D8A|nr:hypothetical protein [Massilia sp. BJB1822]
MLPARAPDQIVKAVGIVAIELLAAQMHYQGVARLGANHGEGAGLRVDIQGARDAFFVPPPRIDCGGANAVAWPDHQYWLTLRAEGMLRTALGRIGVRVIGHAAQYGAIQHATVEVARALAVSDRKFNLLALARASELVTTESAGEVFAVFFGVMLR